MTQVESKNDITVEFNDVNDGLCTDLSNVPYVANFHRNLLYVEKTYNG